MEIYVYPGMSSEKENNIHRWDINGYPWTSTWMIHGYQWSIHGYQWSIHGLSMDNQWIFNGAAGIRPWRSPPHPIPPWSFRKSNVVGKVLLGNLDKYFLENVVGKY
jgi:hypothetical protein